MAMQVPPQLTTRSQVVAGFLSLRSDLADAAAEANDDQALQHTMELFRLLEPLLRAAYDKQD
jgi:hypothetical protein